jgi:hypothetical protein
VFNLLVDETQTVDTVVCGGYILLVRRDDDVYVCVENWWNDDCQGDVRARGKD